MKHFWLLTKVALVTVLAVLSVGAATPEPAQAQLCQVLNNCPPPPAPPNTITVRVDADPDTPTDFSYAGSSTAIGQFVLDDDTDPSVPAARSFSVPNGTYTVTQGAPPGGYEMRAVVCTDPTGNSSGNVANRNATINVSGGEAVECTFKNAQPLTVRCPEGTVPNDQGECVINDERVVCPEGTVPDSQGQCVINDERVVCPEGSTRNAQGQCVVSTVVCPSGTTRNDQGQCVVDGQHSVCPQGSTKNAQGQCVVTDDRVQCPQGSTKNAQGQCVVTDVQCPAGSTKNAQGQCIANETQCPQGSTRNAQGQCVVTDVQCPQGSTRNAQGQCVVNTVVCPEGTTRNAQGQCVVDGQHTVCPQGSTRNAQGECVVTDDRVQCPAGSVRNSAGQCVVTDVQCPQGSTKNAQGQCVVNETQCPQGSTRNAQGQCVITDVQCPQGSAKNAEGQCVVSDVQCPQGSTKNTQGQCVMDGQFTTCPQGSTRNAQGECVVTDERVQCPAGSTKNAEGQCVVTDERVQCPQGSTKNSQGQCVVGQAAPPDEQPPAEEPPAGAAPLPLPLPTDEQPQDGGGSTPVADEAGAAPIVAVARRIAPPWAALQIESGLFRNPLTGAESPGGYGPVMIGHGLLREGRRAGDGSLISAGVRAITATVSRSSGVEENPLQLLAVASAYNWAARNLAGLPAFDTDRAAWERYLATWKSAGVGPGAQGCFESPTCFHSYDLIDAVATLELFASGVQAAAPDARLADPSARDRAISVLGQGAYAAVGRAARTLGQRGRLHRLGILSDSPANPLAYHALSIAALARGISLLGDAAPAEARIALKRAIDATSSFVGPDGDIAYIGRAHGAVWALGATVYAAHVCASSFTAFARSTGRRCDTLAGRTLGRIVREHDFGNVGLNAIPRFRTSGLDDRGLDPYANLISSAGLTAVFLEWAAEERAGRRTPPETPVPLPLEGGGAFVDPAATRFGVMRRGATWFAVHLEPTSLRDPRYDFGLVSLKARGAGRRWSDVLPPRPLPLPGSGNTSSGPVLVRGRTVAYPAGTRMSVDRATGTITIHGGWRTRRGRWLRQGVAFRYRALRDGVRLSFPVEEGDRVTVADFVPAGRSVVGGRSIRTRTFTSTLSPAGGRIARTPGWSSAYDASLVRVARTVEARRDGTVVWTITAR